MRIFDRIDPTTLDHRDTQLWVLALGMIFILACGLAVLMYPAVFNAPVVEVSGLFFRRLFLAFCVMSALLVGYLMDRHLTIRRLRRDLVEEHRRNLELRERGSEDILSSLPGLGQFQDRLSMEFRRASRSQTPLSLLVVNVTSSEKLRDPADIREALADAAKTLIRKLRGEDSIHQLYPGLFGIVLPGLARAHATRVLERLVEGLHDASGASSRFAFEVRTSSYPEDTNSAREMEEIARASFPRPRTELNPPGALPVLVEEPAGVAGEGAEDPKGRPR